MKIGARNAIGFLLILLIFTSGTLGATKSAVADSTATPNARPFSIVVPSSYSPNKPAPLVILLHSYGGSGEQMVNYLQFKGPANLNGVIYVAPNGTQDSSGKRFWNATPECCNFGNSKVNDSQFISDVIDQVESLYTVDQDRIYIIGHSNGAFMSQNIGCNLSEEIAAIVSIAGEQYQDTNMCKPKMPINVLQIQGTSDIKVPYSGGNLGLGLFPGAVQTSQIWAEKDKCESKATLSNQKLSLVSSKLTLDTTKISYENCALGSVVELWSIDGAGHVPIWNSNFVPTLINWILKHPKPKLANSTSLATQSPTPIPTPQLSKSSTPKPTSTPKKSSEMFKDKQ